MDTNDIYAPPRRKIYFLQCNEFVKIGSSNVISSRIRELATGNPYPLNLIACHYGSLQDEKALHKKFSEHKIKNEWFILSEEILEWISQEYIVQETNKIKDVEQYWLDAWQRDQQKMEIDKELGFKRYLEERKIEKEKLREARKARRSKKIKKINPELGM